MSEKSSEVSSEKIQNISDYGGYKDTVKATMTDKIIRMLRNEVKMTTLP